MLKVRVNQVNSPQTAESSLTDMLVFDGYNNKSYFPTGSVGIGTDAPFTKLHIKDTNTDTSVWSRAATVMLQSTSTTNNSWTGIESKSSNNIINAGIGFVNTDQTNNYGRIDFVTRGAGGFLTAMSMNNGQVAIGNNIPMWSGSYGGALVLKGNNATADRYAQLGIVDSTGTLVTTGLVVANSGNVGIGTTAPAHQLTLYQSAPELGFYDTQGSSRNWVIRTGDAAVGDFSIKQSNAAGGNPVSAGTSIFRIDINGAIHYAGASANTWMAFKDAGVLSGYIGAGIGLSASPNNLNTDFAIRAKTKLALCTNNSATAKVTILTDGNVGIGITSPTQLLHVAGNMRLTGGFYDKNNSIGSAGQILTSDGSETYWSAAGSGTISGSGTDNYVPRWNGTTALQNSAIYAKDDGNVGIGTTAPGTYTGVAANLEVKTSGHGGIAINSGAASLGMLAFVQNNSHKWSLECQNNATPYIAFNEASTLRMVIAAGGSVGIGTNAPSQLLHVYSTGVVGMLVETTDGTKNPFYMSKNADARFDFGVAADKSDNFAIRDYNGGSPLYRMLIDSNGVAKFYGTDIKAFAASPNDDATYLRLRHDNSNALVQANRGDLQLSAQNDVYTLDNFGIGTSAPAETLHVYGSDPKIFIDNSNASDGSSRSKIKFGNSGTTYMEIGHLYDSTAGDNAIQILEPTAGGTPLVTFKRDGKVGIGTTAPAELLHLSSATPSIILDKTETGWGALRFYKAGVQVSYISLDASEDMVYWQPGGSGSHQFYAGGAATLKIQNDGKVGIGTTAPYGRLNVHGATTAIGTGIGNSAVFASSSDALAADKGGIIQLGGIYTSGGDVTQWAAIGGFKDNATTANYAGYMSFYTRAQGAAPVERMRIDSSGKVGIGTTAPGASLHIDTSENGTGGLWIKNGGNYAANLVQEAGTAGRLNLYVSNTRYVAISANSDSYFNGGKVGIGTTSPGAKLEVAGGIRLANNSDLDWGDAYRIIRFSTTGDNTLLLASPKHVEVQVDDNGTTDGNFDVRAGSTTIGGGTLLMRVKGDGKVGIGTATPAATLDVNGDVRIGNSTRGHYLGEKGLTINGTTYTTALTIVLSDHNAAHVKLFLTGDWSGHSAVAYVGEYFIQNGAGGYAEPGMIISEFDNTATDFIESKIVDPSTDTFTIQLKLSDSDNGSLGGHICYHVMGEVTSVT